MDSKYTNQQICWENRLQQWPKKQLKSFRAIIFSKKSRDSLISSEIFMIYFLKYPQMEIYYHMDDCKISRGVTQVS